MTDEVLVYSLLFCVALVIAASVVVVMMIWRKRSKKDPVLPNVQL